VMLSALVYVEGMGGDLDIMCSCTVMRSTLVCGGDGWRYKGHSVTSCSCTVMLSALVSLKGMG
jgi:hypothetical protein